MWGLKLFLRYSSSNKPKYLVEYEAGLFKVVSDVDKALNLPVTRASGADRIPLHMWGLKKTHKKDTLKTASLEGFLHSSKCLKNCHFGHSLESIWHHEMKMFLLKRFFFNLSGLLHFMMFHLCLFVSFFFGLS